MKIQYEKWNPGWEAREVIDRANAICEDYVAQGYDLTLRQLFYRFVAGAHIPNTQQSYNRLGSIINKARLAGLLDWDYIVDRTRNLQHVSHWNSPADIIRSAARGFAIDKWTDQPTRIEVWVEKEALAGVIGRTADSNDVAWFSCRGYVSQSELWGAAQRLGAYLEAGQSVIVLHLGDHDPSGIDMTRDISDRLKMFLTQDWVNNGHEVPRNEKGTFYTKDIIAHMSSHVGDVYPPFEIRRIALNMDQINEYQPPPNPTKITDSRATGYIATHGYESWELDALDPSVLDDLIQDEINATVVPSLYEERKAEEATHRALLNKASLHWSRLAEELAEA
jgi:hypothetical protein